MYHCHIRFYLAGHQNQVFEIIKQILPLKHFTHIFSESDQIENTLVTKADVILANLQDMDMKQSLHILLEKKEHTDLILLVEKNQMSFLSEELSKVEDIWILPMEEEEIKFRFLKWQQSCKLKKDFWETCQYFETTINSVPNLIWYKDKDGIHEKVNDSFCKVVNKTKEQVQGRGHAYIWNVEHDDPACIESEYEVMSKRETCVSEEIIQTGDGTRLLTTYKSPLYDL